ncbi:MAG: nitrilase-related carbon-nitrogen hydrolase [Saprospiraceae bacterium]
MKEISDITVQLLQAKIEWHKPNFNLEHFNHLIGQSGSADLIVLPEMWNTGFTMKADLYHSHANEALRLMKEWSLKYAKAIVGSVIVKEDDKIYNRLYFVAEGSVLAHYDKRHLFAFSGEDRSFTAGDSKLVVSYKGWRFCLNICYDLRFPVWARNYEDYDVLIYSANWPDARIDAWQSLLKARAIENQSYVLGCNCYGQDAWRNAYGGHSYLYAYDGSLISEEKRNEQLFTCRLEIEKLKEFRTKFPFLAERDAVKSDWKTNYFTDSK